MTNRIAIAVILLTAAAAHAAQSSAARVSYSERYSVLEQRNIFLRDRTQRPTTAPSSTTQPAKRTSDETFVLTGIVEEGGGYRAYFENLDSGTTVKLGPDDSLPHGRVGKIEIDAVEYQPAAGSQNSGQNAGQNAAQKVWIAVGCDLTGHPSAVLALCASSPDLGPTTSPVISADVAGLNANDPNLTIEQKMKLRRAQQLQGK